MKLPNILGKQLQYLEETTGEEDFKRLQNLGTFAETIAGKKNDFS